ncbi:MAG TPA: diacylglyceryl transferase [Cellvibrio sp.]|nr:diacylglyceryl transferase [Cellvibrio sp.]
MSYTYLTDLINELFGTDIHLPIAMFGTFVGLAIIVAVYLVQREVQRFEKLGLISGIKGNSAKLIGDLAMVAVLFGVMGAKLFDVIERPADLFNDPIDAIFSSGGFSIYGGLIFGFLAGVIFLKKRSIPIVPMLDAVAPALILSYGIGRLGCQISGDGDWGVAADMSLKPEWLPEWFWAQTYENNALGVVINSPGVYPTPLYEALMSFCIFIFLWSVRRRQQAVGQLFFIYLILSGLERILIEKIRINQEYSFWGINATQAEIISVFLVASGLIGFLKLSKSRYIPKLIFSLFVMGALTACATC